MACTFYSHDAVHDNPPNLIWDMQREGDKFTMTQREYDNIDWALCSRSLKSTNLTSFLNILHTQKAKRSLHLD